MNNQILKNETQDLHDNIERVMNAHLLFSNQFRVDHYKNFIIKSYSYISEIIVKTHTDWPEFQEILHQKQQALLIDLNHLEINYQDVHPVWINSENKEYKLGLIYIVLGAMLGNKMILKKLNEYTSFEGFPFAYLSMHQNQLATIWKNFQALINNLDHLQLQKVILGARDGYLLFGK